MATHWVVDSLHEDSVDSIWWNGRELLGSASVEFIDVVGPGTVDEHVQQLQKGKGEVTHPLTNTSQRKK